MICRSTIGSRSRYAFASCSAAAILAACSTSQPPLSVLDASRFSVVKRDSAPERPDYPTSGALVYVTNLNPDYSGVTIYDAKSNDPSPLATITAGVSSPVGACVDGDGTLYIVNEPSSSLGWVSEYPLGKTTPIRTITQDINIPAFCAIDAKGNLWVSNIGGPTVTEYVKGSTTPHRTLRKGLTSPDGVAIDHTGNIYVVNDGASSPMPNVKVFPPGGNTPVRTITDGIGSPGGAAVDRHGTLYVANYLPCDIEEYRAGQSKPYRTITKNLNAPTDVAIAKNGWLYEVSMGNQNCGGPAPIVLELRPGSKNHRIA